MLPCLQECSWFLGCRDLIWLVGIHISQTKMVKLFQTVSLIFQTESLELLTSATKLFSWFKNNYLKANSGKSHILLYGSIGTSSNEKLLWITIDSVLKFENHMTKLCLKFSKKPNTLCRISSFMSIENRKPLIKAFIESQFNYCPLIWMLYSRNQSYTRDSIKNRIF